MVGILISEVDLQIYKGYSPSCLMFQIAKDVYTKFILLWIILSLLSQTVVGVLDLIYWDSRVMNRDSV